MEEQKSFPKKALRRIVRSKWYWIIFLAFPLLAAAILISVPYGIEYAAEQWLLSHGLEVARVEDADFNPFTGTLVLRNLQAKIGESQVLHVPEARMRVYYRPLFNRRAHVEKLSIKDTTVIVEHHEKGHWRIGGLALVAAETVAEQPTAVEKSPEASKVEPYPEQLQPLTEDERLGNLAKQRSAGIKEYLVKNHGIEDDRLLVCLPEYDAREKASPRVELLVP